MVRSHTSGVTLLLNHSSSASGPERSGDSAALFSVLQNHVIPLEHRALAALAGCDVAIWDNRATQRYAINDCGAR